MSDESTPEVAAPEPLVATPDGGQRIADPRERAVQAILSKRIAAEQSTPAAPPSQVSPPEEPAPSPEAPSTQPEKRAAKERDDGREAKLMAELQKRERAAYEAQKRAKELEDKVKAVEAAEARRKANPIDALKDLGYTYEELTKGIVEGKFKAASREELAIDSTKSEVQQLREQLEAIKAERDAQARDTSLSQSASAISEQLASEEVSTQVPVLASLPWAARHLAEYHAQNPEADLDAYAVELDRRASADLKASLSSDRAIKALLADDSVKSRVMAALGITKQSQSQGAHQASQGNGSRNGPAAIPISAATAPASRKTPSKAVTDAERKAAALQAVLAKRARTA